ncbi:MAG TPA: histidinol-phosphate transaminase [Pyrinomonadaceae bacterium]|nr:histidinol-phosphate transaminase [Pyrinomonadaceae bacterium]
MKSRLDIVKPAVRALRPYSLTPHRAHVKINQNENPWDTPRAIRHEILVRFEAAKWSRYPDFSPASLHEHLAEFTGLRPDQIIAGNGSNELIQAAMMVTVGPGKHVLISEPTFALYKQVATVLGGTIESMSLTSSLQYNTELLFSVVEERQPDVIILCSPNNPTGCVIDDADLIKLLEIAHGLVIIDEAYHEFAEHSVVPRLHEHANLIVLRTFSKAMALAGLRVGYLLTESNLAREIRKAVLPYNLNALSQIAAEVSLEKYESDLRPLVKLIIAERERLFSELSQIKGLTPVPSRGNFMVVKSVKDPKQIFADLLERDILVRDVSGYPMLRDYFRVSIGRPEENDRLLKELRAICQ